MAEFPAIPLWTDALLADTGHLDDEELGRYIRILIIMWRSPECRIPNDPAWIAKRLRLQPLEYHSKVLPLLEEFCVTDGNYISQKRLLKEFHFVRKMSKDQSARALKKWTKIREQKEEQKMSVSDNPLEQLDFDICPSDAPTPTPTPTPTDRDTSVSLSSGPRTSGNSPRQKLMDENSRITDAEFETFWAGWRPFDMDKGSKAKARIAYDKARKETNHDHLIATRNAYLSSCHARQQRTKHAVSWLNAKGWDDEYGAAQGQNGQRHQQKASYLDKIQNAGARASEIVKARLAAESFEPWSEQGQIQPPGPPLRLAAGQGPLTGGNSEDVPDRLDGALCEDA